MTQIDKTLNKLRDIFHLEIRAPFSLRVGEQVYEFQCLIEGYGDKQGMVIDKEWEKIAPIKKELVALGFGYSCFDIETAEVGGFQEILDDWGKSNA